MSEAGEEETPPKCEVVNSVILEFPRAALPGTNLVQCRLKIPALFGDRIMFTRRADLSEFSSSSSSSFKQQKHQQHQKQTGGTQEDNFVSIDLGGVTGGFEYDEKEKSSDIAKKEWDVALFVQGCSPSSSSKKEKTDDNNTGEVKKIKSPNSLQLSSLPEDEKAPMIREGSVEIPLNSSNLPWLSSSSSSKTLVATLKVKTALIEGDETSVEKWSFVTRCFARVDWKATAANNSKLLSSPATSFYNLDKPVEVTMKLGIDTRIISNFLPREEKDLIPISNDVLNVVSTGMPFNWILNNKDGLPESQNKLVEARIELKVASSDKAPFKIYECAIPKPALQLAAAWPARQVVQPPAAAAAPSTDVNKETTAGDEARNKTFISAPGQFKPPTAIQAVATLNEDDSNSDSKYSKQFPNELVLSLELVVEDPKEQVKERARTMLQKIKSVKESMMAAMGKKKKKRRDNDDDEDDDDHHHHDDDDEDCESGPFAALNTLQGKVMNFLGEGKDKKKEGEGGGNGEEGEDGGEGLELPEDLTPEKIAGQLKSVEQCLRAFSASITNPFVDPGQAFQVAMEDILPPDAAAKFGAAFGGAISGLKTFQGSLVSTAGKAADAVADLLAPVASAALGALGNVLGELEGAVAGVAADVVQAVPFIGMFIAPLIFIGKKIYKQYNERKVADEECEQLLARLSEHFEWFKRYQDFTKLLEKRGAPVRRLLAKAQLTIADCFDTVQADGNFFVFGEAMKLIQATGRREHFNQLREELDTTFANIEKEIQCLFMFETLGEVKEINKKIDGMMDEFKKEDAALQVKHLANNNNNNNMMLPGQQVRIAKRLSKAAVFVLIAQQKTILRKCYKSIHPEMIAEILDEHNQPISFPLDRVYVPMQVKKRFSVSSPTAAAASSSPQSFSGIELDAEQFSERVVRDPPQSRVLVIDGLSGHGKSTFAKRLSLLQDFTDNKQGGKNYIAIYVSLARMVGGGNNSSTTIKHFHSRFWNLVRRVTTASAMSDFMIHVIEQKQVPIVWIVDDLELVQTNEEAREFLTEFVDPFTRAEQSSDNGGGESESENTSSIVRQEDLVIAVMRDPHRSASLAGCDFFDENFPAERWAVRPWDSDSLHQFPKHFFSTTRFVSFEYCVNKVLDNCPSFQTSPFFSQLLCELVIRGGATADRIKKGRLQASTTELLSLIVKESWVRDSTFNKLREKYSSFVHSEASFDLMINGAGYHALKYMRRQTTLEFTVNVAPDNWAWLLTQSDLTHFCGYSQRVFNDLSYVEYFAAQYILRHLQDSIETIPWQDEHRVVWCHVATLLAANVDRMTERDKFTEAIGKNVAREFFALPPSDRLSLSAAADNPTEVARRYGKYRRMLALNLLAELAQILDDGYRKFPIPLTRAAESPTAEGPTRSYVFEAVLKAMTDYEEETELVPVPVSVSMPASTRFGSWLSKKFPTVEFLKESTEAAAVARKRANAVLNVTKRPWMLWSVEPCARMGCETGIEWLEEHVDVKQSLWNEALVACFESRPSFKDVLLKRGAKVELFKSSLHMKQQQPQTITAPGTSSSKNTALRELLDATGKKLISKSSVVDTVFENIDAEQQNQEDEEYSHYEEEEEEDSSTYVSFQQNISSSPPGDQEETNRQPKSAASAAAAAASSSIISSNNNEASPSQGKHEDKKRNSDSDQEEKHFRKNKVKKDDSDQEVYDKTRNSDSDQEEIHVRKNKEKKDDSDQEVYDKKETHQMTSAAATSQEEEAATSSSSPTINNNNNAAINVAISAEGTSTTAIANSNVSGSVTSVSNSENVNIDARNVVENIQNKTVNNYNITQNIIQQQQEQEHKSSSPLLAIRLPRVQKKSLDLDEDNQVGSGSTCSVYQAEYENQEVAVKMFHPHVYANSTVQREIENLLFLQHPNIIRIFALVVHKPKQLKSKSTSSPNSPSNSGSAEEKVVGIICELLGENLQDYLVANHSSVSPTERLIWARQIASAISCAHRNKVAHSDIKPENILLSQTAPFICHLSDFGSSSAIKTATAATATSSVKSTPGYLAPELIADEGTRPTAASDIFSFGGVLWFLFHPNVDHGLGNTSDRINFAVVSGKRPPISKENCPTEVATLIEECWCQKPEARPHVGNVLKRISDLIPKEK